MKQRIIALFFALLIVIALVPPTSASAAAYTDSEITAIFTSQKGYINGKENYDMFGIFSLLKEKNISFYCDYVKTGDGIERYELIVMPNDVSSFINNNGTISTGGVNAYLYEFNNLHDTTQKVFKIGGSNTGIFSFPYGSAVDLYWGSGYSRTLYSTYYFNLNKSDLGDNDLIPPVPLSEQNVKDFTINTLRINLPNSATVLNGGIPEMLQNVTFECEAKVSLPSSLNGDFPKILEYGNQFKQEVCDSIVYNYCGLTGTSAMPTVELYGKPYDWNNNKFITFKVKGTFQLNTWDISSATKSGDFTIGFNLQNDYRATRFSSSTYTWLSASNKVNLTYSVDVDGDNIDDVTGEIVPPVPILDNDGDGVADDVADGSGVTDFFGTFTESIKSIPSFTSEIANAYNGILGFLPQPIPLLITGALFTMIFVTVISFIRGN